jgi:hypothetical protein
MKCKQTKINTGYNWKCINCNRHDVDKNCNIIPKKKAQDKVVKAWANMGSDNSFLGIYWYKAHCYSIPVACTIRIKASDYEKLRGKK